MTNSLPSRPDLDHLRRQAKTLLAALAEGDVQAIRTLQEHLPAARGLTGEQILAAGFRLADAQSAIARRTGFAGWPHLSRHVDTLRALEGTWSFAALTVDGASMPAAALAASRLLIDGDRFRTESPEANYEGVFNLDVEAEPHHIDIDFVAGPEAGKSNHGIFCIDGDTLELCLDLNGRPRPTAFHTAPGSGHAHEVLRRSSRARPEAVTGGTPPARTAPAPAADPAAFPFVPSPLLAQLQGEWSAVAIVRDGQTLPPAMCKTGRRSARENEVKITFGGQLVIHALVRLDANAQPIHVDYCNLGGATAGTLQHGITEWCSGDACFCMAAPGQPRPVDFTCPPGSGQTFSRWRRQGSIPHPDQDERHRGR